MDARLPKWLRGYVEVVVQKCAWVRIPHLANKKKKLKPKIERRSADEFGRGYLSIVRVLRILTATID